jgi:O-antigen/teichoic acid export membrane protein
MFGENWTEAGAYARYLLPWIFMMGLTMPLAFLPDMYRKQKTALVIDGIRLIFRLMGLIIGVVQNNVYLALMLYSGASTIFIGVNLIWYTRLAKTPPPVDPGDPEKVEL